MELRNYLFDNFEKYERDILKNTILEKLGNTLLEELPHLNFYGVAGSLKDFYVKYLIGKLHNTTLQTAHIKEEKVEIKPKETSTKIRFTVFHNSLYYSEINFATITGNELYVITKYIKEIVSSKHLTSKHIYVLNNFNEANQKVFSAFRRIMEKYMNNVLFICVSNTLATIPDPIKSRLLNIRMPILKDTECINLTIALIHDFYAITTIKKADIKKICGKCENDIYKVMIYIENNLMESGKFKADDIVNPIEKILKTYYTDISRLNSPDKLLYKHRELYTKLVAVNISPQNMIIQIHKYLMKNKYKILVENNYAKMDRLMRFTIDANKQVVSGCREDNSIYVIELYLIKITDMLCDIKVNKDIKALMKKLKIK